MGEVGGGGGTAYMGEGGVLHIGTPKAVGSNPLSSLFHFFFCFSFSSFLFSLNHFIFVR